MKKILFSIYALSLFTAVHAQKLDRSIRPKAGPAPEIKLGDAESFTMDNGMKVFVVENHKLPAVTYSIQLDVQPEPEGNKSGMNSMVGELITSGTKTRTKDKFDEEVIDRLKALSFEQINPIIPELLEWLQDINWPISGPIVQLLNPFVNRITPEIIKILKTDDGLWKLWILVTITRTTTDPLLLAEIERIAKFPTRDEIEEGVNLEAISILNGDYK